MPEFTEEDHEASRAEGCADAYDRWQTMTATNQFMNSHERMRREAKAMFRKDLESVGLPPEVLGAVSKAGNMMPASPDFRYPEEVNVPSDPVVREACVEGMMERLQRLYDRLDEIGVSTEADSDEAPPEHQDAVWNLRHEIARVERRLDAFSNGSAEAAQDSWKAEKDNEDVEEENADDQWNEPWPDTTDAPVWD
jgi:hypothetical protein